MKCDRLSLERDVTECCAKHTSAKTAAHSSLFIPRAPAANQRTQAWQGLWVPGRSPSADTWGQIAGAEGHAPFPSEPGTALWFLPRVVMLSFQSIFSRSSRFVSTSNVDRYQLSSVRGARKHSEPELRHYAGEWTSPNSVLPS